MQMTRRALLGASAAGVLLAACARQGDAGDLNAILDRLSTDILHEFPEFATSLAVSEEQAGGCFPRQVCRLARHHATAQPQLCRHSAWRQFEHREGEPRWDS